VIVFRLFQGRKVRAFKPRSSSVRNEQLDTFVYAYAAMVGRGGAAVVDRRTTVQVEEPVVEIPLTQSQQFRRRTPPPQPRRGSWATGWNR
jgi:phage terminase large subunit GpA-like protein